MTDSLIRLLERIMRVDVRYLFRGLFWFFFQHILLAGSGLISAVIFANLLPKEVYGTYRYILSIASVLTIATVTRIDDSLSVSVAKGFEGDFFGIYKTRIKWGLFGALAGAILGIYWFTHHNALLGTLALITAFFVPFFEPPTVYNGFLIGKKNFKKLSLLGIANNLLYTAAIVAVVFATKNIILIITVYFLINTVTRTATFFYVYFSERPNAKTEPRTYSYGKRLSLLDILAVISGQIDSILLFHYLGAAELAAYTFIKRVPEHIKVIPKYVTALSTPRFSTKNISDPQIKKEAVRKTAFLFLSLLAVSAVYILFAPVMFRYLFAPYQQYTRLSQLYALSLPLNFGGLFLNFIETSRKERIVAKLGVVSTVLRIAVIVFSLKFFGLVGLVAGFLITRFVTTLMRMYFFFRA